MQINLIGPAEVGFMVAKHMMKNRGGSLVYITSGAAHLGSKDIAYSASKHGLLGVVKSFAKNFTPHGVYTFAIAPGVIKTSMSDVMSEAHKQEHIGKTFNKRIGRVDEVADVVKFILNEKPEYMSGQTFHINGGIYLG